MKTASLLILVFALNSSTGVTASPEKADQPNDVPKTRLGLVFKGYDGDPAKPETINFQINSLSSAQPVQFLKLGERISSTKFKLDKFTYKTRRDPTTGADQDVSELTIINAETKQPVVLVLNKVLETGR